MLFPRVASMQGQMSRLKCKTSFFCGFQIKLPMLLYVSVPMRRACTPQNTVDACVRQIKVSCLCTLQCNAASLVLTAGVPLTMPYPLCVACSKMRSVLEGLSKSKKKKKDPASTGSDSSLLIHLQLGEIRKRQAARQIAVRLDTCVVWVRVLKHHMV